MKTTIPMMRSSRLTGCLFAIAAAIAAAPSRGEDAAADGLSAADLDRLHRTIRPQPGESRWMEIDWYPTVHEARRRAAIEGKPIFLMAGSGGAPAAGC